MILVMAALVIGVIALVSSGGKSDEFDDDFEFHLSDRGEFTDKMMVQALQRYENEGREATVRHYNSPESVGGEWYVFILNEDG